MFEFKSKIRFSETDEKSKLTLPALLNYFQDCSTFQTELIGPTIAEMREKHFAWVLVKWHIEINDLPSICDDVIIGTIPYSCRRCNGMRSYYIKNEDGGTLAYADTLWALIDTESAKLIRADKTMEERFSTGEKLEMPEVSKKITFEGEPVFEKIITFSDSDQDSYRHVNNAKTVAAAWELVSEEKQLTRLRTEFRRQIFSGDEITASIYEDGNRSVVVFKNSGGETATVCEFTAK